LNAVEYSVVVHRLAQQDVENIYAWLSRRSRPGAVRWYAAFLQAVENLRRNPARCPLAREASRIGVEVREQFFKTRRGRRYRLLFMMDERIVRVLRIRGPGRSTIR
jgi:plasmid stabilization system protein ParE